MIALEPLARIEVAGTPVPKGSKRIVRRSRPGDARGKPTGDPILLDEHAHELRAWERDIRTAAATAWHGRPLLTGPVYLSVMYYLRAPQRALTRDGTGIRDGVLPSVKPDLDKLDRAIRDALTGVVYVDDGQITDAGQRKRYSPRWTGAVITVRSATEVAG